MNPTVTCACGAVAEPFEEEVDIGVGIQRFLTGWQCPDHGGICGVCYGCGTAEKIGYTHELWCKEHPGVTNHGGVVRRRRRTRSSRRSSIDSGDK